ncbi:MAG: gluconolactonase [Actinomycetota bacterium]|jgi:gluconolactonase
MIRANETISIDRDRAALIIQDMQNDAISEGGAFADSGAPHHAAEQNVVENCRRLADACRKAGVPVIHIWYVVEDGAKGLKLNAPLFEGVQNSRALVKGSWGAEPVRGLERRSGDLLVEKMRMSGWQDTILESLLRGLDRDQVIVTGAWTNMSIEHTARSGADRGLLHVRVRGLLLDDERRLAQRIDQLRTAERLDSDELRRGRRRDRRV